MLLYFLPIGSEEIAEGHKKLIDRADSKVSEKRYSIIRKSNDHFTNWMSQPTTTTHLNQCIFVIINYCPIASVD